MFTATPANARLASIPLLLLAFQPSVAAGSAPGAPAATPTPVGARDLPLDPDLERVAAWMSGDFDTFDQVADDVASQAPYTHLRAVMHIVPAAIAGLSEPTTRTFYVEQAAADALDKPYRQRVYRLMRSDGALVNRIFKIDEPARFAGAYARPELLAGLSAGHLVAEKGCDLVWTRINETLYSGVTGIGGSCKSTWRGGAYAVSQVQLTPTSILSLDQGFDEAGVHRWGPKPGTVGHRFVKREPGRRASAQAVADEFAALRAGSGAPVFWYAEGTLYSVTADGSLTPISGLVGYNVASIEKAPGTSDSRMRSREIFIYTDAARMAILADRAPILNTVELGIGVRGDRPLACLGFTSNGRDLGGAVPPVEIMVVGRPDGRKLLSLPFVNVQLGERNYWAAEYFEFTVPAAAAADGYAGATLIWQRDTELPKLGRVHFLAAGRRFPDLEAVSSSSAVAKALVRLVREKYPEYAQPPTLPASPTQQPK